MNCIQKASHLEFDRVRGFCILEDKKVVCFIIFRAKNKGCYAEEKCVGIALWHIRWHTESEAR